MKLLAAILAVAGAVALFFALRTSRRPAADVAPTPAPETASPMNKQTQPSEPALPGIPQPLAGPPPPFQTPEKPAPNAIARRISASPILPQHSGDRVAAARERSSSAVRAMFAEAGVSYPAHEIFLRGFKRERELELWASGRGESLRRVAVYEVAALSGKPGPKRREGDGQVPEGFYEVDRFNPKSGFHLSLGLNYPNAADRILSDPRTPGYDIFIHGANVSIGCLAMGDDRIEEIYLAALDSRARPLRVHLFPARMDAPDWPEWRIQELTKNPAFSPLWEQLVEGFALFEKTKRIPAITVLPGGSYRCSPGN